MFYTIWTPTEHDVPLSGGWRHWLSKTSDQYMHNSTHVREGQCCSKPEGSQPLHSGLSRNVQSITAQSVSLLLYRLWRGCVIQATCAKLQGYLFAAAWKQLSVHTNSRLPPIRCPKTYRQNWWGSSHWVLPRVCFSLLSFQWWTCLPYTSVMPPLPKSAASYPVVCIRKTESSAIRRHDLCIMLKHTHSMPQQANNWCRSL